MIVIEKKFSKQDRFEDIDYFIDSIVDNMDYKADFEVDVDLSHKNQQVLVKLKIFERQYN